MPEPYVRTVRVEPSSRITMPYGMDKKPSRRSPIIMGLDIAQKHYPEMLEGDEPVYLMYCDSHDTWAVSSEPFTKEDIKEGDQSKVITSFTSRLLNKLASRE